MKNIIELLKGKSYNEGIEIVQREVGKQTGKEYSNIEKGLCDNYVYVKDYENWICFTCPAEEREGDEPILYEDKGYWSQCIDGFNETTI